MYKPINWKDRAVEHKHRYELSQAETPGLVYLKPSPGEVEESGTPLCAENLNHMDNAIFDHDAQLDEINKKLKAEDVSEDKVIFKQASKRANITSGEKLSVLFGKVAKWFTDLKTVAFSGSYNDLTDKPKSMAANGGNSDTVNGHTVDTDVPENAVFTDTWRPAETVLMNQDLNDVTIAGFYSAPGNNTIANKPSLVSNFGLQVIHSAGGKYYTQKLYTLTSQYTRRCNNGTWSAWEKDKLTDTTYDAGIGLLLSEGKFTTYKTITELSDAGQLTHNGAYHINAIAESTGCPIYNIGDFHAMLLSGNVSTDAGCRFGTLLLASPRIDDIWGCRIWEYKFSEWTILNRNESGVAARDSTIATAPWFLLGEFSTDLTLNDFLSTFFVQHTFYDCAKASGILTVHVRTGNPISASLVEAKWLTCNDGIVNTDFAVCTKIVDNKLNVRLYTKLINPWVGCRATLLDSGIRTGLNKKVFTLYNSLQTTGDEELPSGYDVKYSEYSDDRLKINNKVDYATAALGMTENLIPFPYKNDTMTANGIAWTVNSDGTITANGTATADAIFLLQNFSVSAGTYTISGAPNVANCSIQLARGNSWAMQSIAGATKTITYSVDNAYTYCRCLILKGTTVSNAVFMPQLERGKIAHSYIPYRNNKTGYAICTTGRATVAKVAELADFVLTVGTTVAVKFTDTDGTANPTSGNLTLNINGTGAKTIAYFRHGAKAALTYAQGNLFYNNLVHIFTYDGTYWLCMDWNEDNNTTYSSATTTADGLMSKTDKTKSDETNVAYGTCSTAAATAAKVVTLANNSNWQLKIGARVIVKYTVTNTASDCTINVNGTGAKPIWYNASKYTGNGTYACGIANHYIEYMYDGTYWVWMGHSSDNNTTYSDATTSDHGLMSVEDKIKVDAMNIGCGTCSTAAGTSAKVVTLTDNSGWKLKVGAIIVVKFSAANTASNCTINVNGTGAKPIWYNNAKYTSNSSYICGFAGRYIKYMYDGTYWVWLGHGVDYNDTYDKMTGATESKAGKTGLVPAPAAGEQDMFLRGDGTWGTPTADTTTQDDPDNGYLQMTFNKKVTDNFMAAFIIDDNKVSNSSGMFTGIVSDTDGTMETGIVQAGMAFYYNLICFYAHKNSDPDLSSREAITDGAISANYVMGTDDFYSLGNDNLGNSLHRWKQLYASTATISTSDRNLKDDICDLDGELTKAFVLGLKPSSYKLIEGDSGRTHYGLVSQDVEELMAKLNMSSLDFAGFIKSPKYDETLVLDEKTGGKTMERKIVEDEYIYSLRYEEFIAPLIKMVQMQQKEIDDLKIKVKQLLGDKN